MRATVCSTAIVAPFGMTVSVEPHWGFVDETSGMLIRHFGWEGDLLFDRALVPDRPVRRAEPALSTPTGRRPPPAAARISSPRSASVLALAGQAMPGVWIGGEARYFRAYQGAGLEIFTGHALYLGPTLYMKLGEKAWLSAAFDVQARGGTSTAPGALDLVDFERYQANFRLGFEF